MDGHDQIMKTKTILNRACAAQSAALKSAPETISLIEALAEVMPADGAMTAADAREAIGLWRAGREADVCGRLAWIIDQVDGGRSADGRFAHRQDRY